MHYVPEFSAGRNKFDVSWVDGVWIGIKLERGGSTIGTPEGVVKVREVMAMVIAVTAVMPSMKKMKREI